MIPEKIAKVFYRLGLLVTVHQLYLQAVALNAKNVYSYGKAF